MTCAVDYTKRLRFHVQRLAKIARIGRSRVCRTCVHDAAWKKIRETAAESAENALREHEEQENDND